jgi:hypothetical protein
MSGLLFFHYDRIFKSNWEITDELDGNIFPSIVLSMATSHTEIILPADSNFLGNPKSTFAIRIESPKENAHLRIELDESPYYNATVTDFDLPQKGKIYTVYPQMTWKYDNMLIDQPKPLDVSIRVFINDKSFGSDTRTFSVRSINECLLGYKDKNKKYHDTGILFAAYVNEDHPMIDKILREALDTRIVRLFQGYQTSKPENVKKQVYAIWYALQQRNFKYSSISKTSLSSDMLFSQRVRTVGNSLESSQINCLDGTVLFASFLRAINIDPIIVRIPGHVFVGCYLDKKHTEKLFLETTFIGQIDLDDYMSDQYDEALVYENDTTIKQIDTLNLRDFLLDTAYVALRKSTTKSTISKATFDFAVKNATERYEKYKDFFGKNKPNYMYLEINNDIRKKIQPIGN